MKALQTVEDMILKYHQHFFYDRQNKAFIAGDLLLNIEPIVFGDDSRDGVSYNLYQDDNLICDVGMDYDEFRYCDYANISNGEHFLQDLKQLETQIEAYVTPCLTDDDLDLEMEYGEINGYIK